MSKYDTGIQEEELKHCVAEDWFTNFDCKRVIGKIDFCVELPATPLGIYGADGMLWAEAKAGRTRDIVESFVQLILTIGKSRVTDDETPPRFLGAFDAEKIAFLPYDSILDVLSQNDFNWNVTPSNHETKEFKQLYGLAGKTIEEQSLLFDYEKDEKDLHKFIKENFVAGRRGISRLKITRNNFTHIYQKWRRKVLPSLNVDNWNALRKEGIIDADFFLADILSDKDNRTLRKKLFVLLQSDVYEVKYGTAESGLDLVSRIGFNDGQAAHKQFWNHYVRPPRRDYWDFIVERRDLLVDQDVRERKGAFFTPQQWVELSQEYLAKELGENWQDEYIVWDCCAGTGNLESGLTNKYNIWASTIDKADVDAMHTRIKMMNENAEGAANLLDSHVFQFDFLNDSFDKLPKGLKEIINDPEKRKRLIVYINPPYAEHGNRRVIAGEGEHKTNVARATRTHAEFVEIVGTATRELYIQFFLQIRSKIPGCLLGTFSTMKYVCSQNCREFRNYWGSTFLRGFVCPSYTFDNVKGSFPIGFLIWRIAEIGESSNPHESVTVDVVDSDSQYVGQRTFFSCNGIKMISDWLRGYYDKRKEDRIGFIALPGVSMQQQGGVYFTTKPTASDVKAHKVASITKSNVIPMAVYLAVRHCIEAEWINNKDEFLFPADAWSQDGEFCGDCLVYSLFSNANNVKSEHGINHWIPFAEEEVAARDCFRSHFMSDFLNGKAGLECDELFQGLGQKEFVFSSVARSVLDAGRELWRYYHAQSKANPNASYYDIRKHFQGMKVTAKGREQMSPTSDDEKYNELHVELKMAMKQLAAKIAPKVYEYGFLRK